MEVKSFCAPLFMGYGSLEREEKGFHLIHINVKRFMGKAYLLMFAPLVSQSH